MKLQPRTFVSGIRLVGKMAVRLARIAIGREKLIIYRMPQGVPLVTRRHEVIELTASAATAHSIPWATQAIEARLASGARLFALRMEKHLVSFAWVSYQRTFRAGEIRRELKLESPLHWIWDCVTPIEFRGHGYYPELISHLAARLGQRDVVIFVRTDNTPSVRGIGKAGFQPWVEIGVTRWSARIVARGTFDGRLTISS